MASEILADTSGLYAVMVAGDDQHRKACSFLRDCARRKQRFVVTDYIVDETLTLLKARGLGAWTEVFLDGILNSTACRIEWMNPERFDRVKVFFLKHSDKSWSFTDCFSFILMKELKIHDALSKDEDFKAAGFRPLLT